MNARKYAAKTKVPFDRSRLEIERTLTAYSADGFGYATDADREVISFKAQGRFVRFELARVTAKSHPRLTDEGREQERRRRWRTLAQAVKVKLDLVQSGITSFEEEFLAHIVMPDGQRVGSWMRPQLATAYASGRMPALLDAHVPSPKEEP